MTTTSDPTTPDAVERQYQDSDGNPCDLVTLCRREPEWAASRLAFERDIIASLRDQLRKVEGERDEAVAHRLNVATDGVSDPWRPIEECGELARGRYLVQLRSGAQLVALWSGDSEGWVLRQRDLDEFDSPRDITHVHQMGTIRGPGETDGNV